MSGETKLTKTQHPLTPLLQQPDGHIPKRYVEKMNLGKRYLRPFWKGAWGCWCVRDGGPQQIFRLPNGDLTVNRPAETDDAR